MFRTIDEIRHANRRSGQHFFDPATLAHWHSQPTAHVFPLSAMDGALWIDSVKYSDNGPRVYKIRWALSDGKIKANSWPDFTTESAAMGAAAQCAMAYGRKWGNSWDDTAAVEIMRRIKINDENSRAVVTHCPHQG